MTDKPTIAALLAAGRVEFDTPTGWRAADTGLRDEVVNAVIKGGLGKAVHEALLEGRPISFRDDEKDITVRWSPQ